MGAGASSGRLSVPVDHPGTAPRYDRIGFDADGGTKSAVPHYNGVLSPVRDEARLIDGETKDEAVHAAHPSAHPTQPEGPGAQKLRRASGRRPSLTPVETNSDGRLSMQLLEMRMRQIVHDPGEARRRGPSGTSHPQDQCGLSHAQFSHADASDPLCALRLP